MKTNIISKLAILSIFGAISNISAGVTDREKSRPQEGAVDNNKKPIPVFSEYSKFDDEPERTSGSNDELTTGRPGYYDGKSGGGYGLDGESEEIRGKDGESGRSVYNDQNQSDTTNWITNLTPDFIALLNSLLSKVTNQNTMSGLKTVFDLNEIGRRTTRNTITRTDEAANAAFDFGESIQRPIRNLSKSITSSIPLTVNNEIESALEYTKRRVNKGTKDIIASLEKKPSKNFASL